jgi:uncharacterized protein (DUF1778 family)
MGRYERRYTGEKRTYGLHLKLTPSEQAELQEAAAGQGVGNLSAFARELLFRRAAAVVAATRRNPEAKAIADELRAVGINLNQLQRHANTTGELGPERVAEVDQVLRAIKHAAARVLDL